MINRINSYSSDLYSRMTTVSMQKQNDQKFAKLDTDGNGSLSKDEFQVLMNKIAERTGLIPDVDKMFESADTDGDGLLTETEMENARPQGPPPLPPMMDMASSESTNSLDTNGDGVVNALDFIENTSDLAQYYVQNPTDKMFAELDTDGDGMISKSEFQVFADKIAEMTGMTINIDATFESADTDGDGLLSKSEMGKLLPQGPPSMMGMSESGKENESTSTDIVDEQVSSLISSLDTNGDGVIDASELKIALMQIKLDAYSLFNNKEGETDNWYLNLFG